MVVGDTNEEEEGGVDDECGVLNGEGGGGDGGAQGGRKS